MVLVVKRVIGKALIGVMIWVTKAIRKALYIAIYAWYNSCIVLEQRLEKMPYSLSIVSKH